MPLACIIIGFVAWGLATWCPGLFASWNPFGGGGWLPIAELLGFIVLLILVLSYLWSHVKWATGTRDPWYKTLHVVAWRLKFYDRTLSDRVSFARHAISLDERRKDFPRVPWFNSPNVSHSEVPGLNWFEQIWFAGNHADIGGGYPENESRLSDIALKWMADEARRIPHPILVDESYLMPYPSSVGMMHDECKGSLIPWFTKARSAPDGAFLHYTVFERLGTLARNFDTMEVYNPPALQFPPDKPKKFHRYDPMPLDPNAPEP